MLSSQENQDTLATLEGVFGRPAVTHSVFEGCSLQANVSEAVFPPNVSV